MQTPCMPSFTQLSPAGQSDWLVQMTSPLQLLDVVHDIDVRLVAQQTSPDEHVCIPHFGPPVPPLLVPLDPPLLLVLPPFPPLLELVPWPLLLPPLLYPPLDELPYPPLLELP
jgi:hypothetical protein